ncbi:MAG: iron ABC transporter permease [Lachnospiraceae bacterium]|nr:iron ABC transporter permease [Lachnospiraceae bacterium]
MQNDYRKGLKRYHTALLMILVLLACGFLISLFTGRYDVKREEVILFLRGYELPELPYRVICNLRIPRTIMAMLTGGALALSGGIYQGIFNNQMASPDLLGVSTGASFGACVGILLHLPFAGVVGLAFVAGLLTVTLTLLIGKWIGKEADFSLVLAGIAAGGLMSSAIGLTKYLADDERKLAEITYWLMGSFAGTTIKEVFFIAPLLLICFAVSLLVARQVDAISFGKKEAKTLGVSYEKMLLLLIFMATLMTATCVSVNGTISWVGLTVPNLVRMVFGNQHRKVLMLSILLGALFLLLADMMARSLSPDEIPLSVITGFVGTPVFIPAIMKTRSGEYEKT